MNSAIFIYFYIQSAKVLICILDFVRVFDYLYSIQYKFPKITLNL